MKTSATLASWQLQDAETHLSELIEDACAKGPQIITRHGCERAVVLSIEEYRAMAPTKKEEAPNFIDWLLGGPKFPDDDDFFTIMDEIQADRKRHGNREIVL